MDHDPGPSDEPEDHNDEVGYGRPPVHARWKAGDESPNPNGRPKNAKGRRAILQRIAAEMCEVRVGSKVVVMSRIEVVLTAVRNATANGSPAAQRLYDKLLNEVREEGPTLQKGVLIGRERLTVEEWEAEYGYLGGIGSPPPSRKRGLMPASAQ